MKDLGKWQLISFVSRGLAVVLGLIQAFAIVRILTVSEWGLVQLAISIGGAVGIYQHLGLASASTREISTADTEEEVYKIFFTSLIIRYLVSLPVAIGLYFFAGYLARNIHHNLGIIIPLKIYAVTLVFQGLQSILNSVIAGRKKFKNLFTYQVAIAIVSVSLYIPFVFWFKVNGYFIAFLVFNVISSFVLTVLAFGKMRKSFVLPSIHDFKRLFVELFVISIGIYIVKIIYTNWEKFGGNVLGIVTTTEIVGIYSLALLFAKKIMHISDSVTDVNLPVFSEQFVKDAVSFKESFSKNFDKIFAFIILSATVGGFWVRELVLIFLGKEKLLDYSRSLPLIPPLLISFVLYSFINIVKSSVLIPSKMTKEMVVSFFVLMIATAGFFFSMYKTFDILLVSSYSMCFGAFTGVMAMDFFIKRKFGFTSSKLSHWAIVFQAFLITFLGYLNFSAGKIALFLFTHVLLLWAFFIAGVVSKDDFRSTINKFKKFL